ncbi:PSS-domain-containing protein [Exidia glandulosa HHB12029]|uniref:PSS-domain-containing protein n=1 Tax=Exidia glandulosa HHB12029 TaxID=1314781 RepID=A0A165G5F7_EXIGL|nr:PSS-domain-containing protein [Exidia glandulosa HHB12029]
MSTPIHEDPGYASPTSPSEDPGYQSPEPPPPGIDGQPVRWFDANRNEPYTRIVPFSETQDSSVEWFFTPTTLTALAVAMGVLAYIGMSRDVLDEGEDKRRLGVWAALSGFLLFSMIQFRDGPFVRPHPAFWRVVLGVNLIYELAMVFLLFQDLGTARHMMTLLDPNLGVPLPEKSYAEDCTFTFANVWNAVDIFCLAHALGWFGKALILRDYWFCWILSIAFEFAEYSLQHQLANFAECWWDHWILDVLVCNWLGLWLGMKTCEYLEVKPFVWRGKPRGVRARTRRVLKQFAPHDFTSFQWEGTADFAHYTAVFFLLAVFLAAELNPFYLKSLLWMEPEHPFVIARLAGVFLCALPAVRELYLYVSDPRKAIRMGQHAWLLLATVGTELLVIFKWGRGLYPEPFPLPVKWGFALLAATITIYPTIKFGIPATRRYLRRHGRERKLKQS